MKKKLIASEIDIQLYLIIDLQLSLLVSIGDENYLDRAVDRNLVCTTCIVSDQWGGNSSNTKVRAGINDAGSAARIREFMKWG